MDKLLFSLTLCVFLAIGWLPFGAGDIGFNEEAEKQLFEIRLYLEEYKSFESASEGFRSRKDLLNSLQHTENLLEHVEKLFRTYRELEESSEAVLFNASKLKERKKRELNAGIALLWLNLAIIDGQCMTLLRMNGAVSEGLLNGT